MVHADSGMLIDVMFVLLSVCLHYSYYRVMNAMTTNMESSTVNIRFFGNSASSVATELCIILLV